MTESTIKRLRLGDHCEVARGIAWSREQESDSGVPALTIPNIQETLDTTKLTFLSGLRESVRNKARVRAGHTIMVGSNGNRKRVGDCVYFDADTEFVFASFLLGVRPTDDQLDPRYLYYWLKSAEFRNPQQAALVGATSLGNLRVTAVRDVLVPAPPVLVQRRIATILATYDRLIENNERRIAVLEKMARAFYREWFAELRFPGHEDAEMVTAGDREIPKGWEVKPTADAFEFCGGATPSTKEPAYWTDGTVIWYSPTDLTKSGTMFISEGEKRITEAGLAACSARLFPAYSVMMTSRATLGVLGINTTEACTNQGFITCIPNNRVTCSHLYLWLDASRVALERLGTGATFKEITKRAFREFPILIAPEAIEQAFHAKAWPVFRLIENLLAKNRNLRTTRDLLLSNLISGALDASNLDIVVAERGV